MIAKGTIVKITTTNGGELVAPLLQNYRPTYDICLGLPNGHYLNISNIRLKTVEVV